VIGKFFDRSGPRTNLQHPLQQHLSLSLSLAAERQSGWEIADARGNLPACRNLYAAKSTGVAECCEASSRAPRKRSHQDPRKQQERQQQQQPAGRGWKRGSESSGWKRGGVKDGENRVAVVGRKTEDGCNKVNSIRHYGGGEAPPASLVAGWPARRLFSSAESIRAPQNGRLVVGKVDGACARTATGLLSRVSPRIAVAYARAVRNGRWF